MYINCPNYWMGQEVQHFIVGVNNYQFKSETIFRLKFMNCILSYVWLFVWINMKLNSQSLRLSGCYYHKDLWRLSHQFPIYLFGRRCSRKKFSRTSKECSFDLTLTSRCKLLSKWHSALQFVTSKEKGEVWWVDGTQQALGSLINLRNNTRQVEKTEEEEEV